MDRDTYVEWRNTSGRMETLPLHGFFEFYVRKGVLEVGVPRVKNQTMMKSCCSKRLLLKNSPRLNLGPIDKMSGLSPF